MTQTTAPGSAVVPAGTQRARAGGGARTAIALVVLVNLALIAGVTWVTLNPQRVTDQLVVWQYEPPVAIAQYAERTTMTDEGMFLFYASEPRVARDDAFDTICASQAEDVGILGCYLPGPQRIYLYDVTDERLNGLEEVVAAHEMLHAVWDRLPQSERERLAVLLEAEVAARADDEDLAETLAFYAEAEPGQRANELHSIVATEFSDISDELEEHFALYFTDRSAIVRLHEVSSAVFSEQEAQIDALVARLEELDASISADQATYNAGYDQLNADIGGFNSRAEAGDFSSQDQFDRERSTLLQRQADLDALYRTIDARVTEYNALIDQLDELNARVTELNEAINIAPRSEEGL